MPKVDVILVAGRGPAADRIEEQLNQARAAIEERAYHVARERAGGGDVLENWIAAERQLFHVPSCELVEHDGELRLRAAVPGFEASQIRLTALPTAIVIQSDSASRSKTGNGGASGKIHFTELNRNSVLRRVDLPTEIKVDSVKARIKRGILEVVALKKDAQAKPPCPKKAAAPAKKKSAARRKKTS